MTHIINKSKHNSIDSFHTRKARREDEAKGKKISSLQVGGTKKQMSLDKFSVIGQREV